MNSKYINIVSNKRKDILIIIAEGNIGAGKTSLLDRFEDNKHIDVIKEPLDKWYNTKGIDLIGEYYKDRLRYGYAFQVNVLTTIYNQMLEKIALSNKNIFILERGLSTAYHVFTQHLFSLGFINQYELITLETLYNSLNLDILKPNSIIYLKCSPETCMQRIIERNRECETAIGGITLDELKSLQRFTNNYIDTLSDFYLYTPISNSLCMSMINYNYVFYFETEIFFINAEYNADYVYGEVLAYLKINTHDV